MPHGVTGENPRPNPEEEITREKENMRESKREKGRAHTKNSRHAKEGIGENRRTNQGEPTYIHGGEAGSGRIRGF